MQLFNTLKQDLEPRLNRYKTIGFFMSGGFDSSMLLYACCLWKQQDFLENQFVALTVPRYDDSVLHTTRILSYIMEKFSLEIPLIHVGNPDLHHSRQVESGCVEAYEKNLADLFLLGCTAVPQELPKQLVRNRSSWDRLYQPWFDFTKDHTVKLMLELEGHELISLTHTCTESKTIRCGECWQCRERAWAFAKVGIADHGTM
jgi:hypothetical protein